MLGASEDDQSFKLKIGADEVPPYPSHASRYCLETADGPLGELHAFLCTAAPQERHEVMCALLLRQNDGGGTFSLSALEDVVRARVRSKRCATAPSNTLLSRSLSHKVAQWKGGKAALQEQKRAAAERRDTLEDKAVGVLDEEERARIRLELKQATKECKDLRVALLSAAKGLYAPKLFGGADPPSELAGTSFWEVELEDGIYATLKLADETTLKEGIYACLAPGGDGGSSTAQRPYKALVFVSEAEDSIDAPDELETNVRILYDVVDLVRACAAV